MSMTLWKCPDPDCPPTEREPILTGEPDGVGPSESICRSDCGEVYPRAAFTQVAE